MAEGEVGGAKVRVVRCPKCDKLLPELANFTVYRCGGCDATLQAKKKPSVFEASLEKSDGELSKYNDKNSEADVVSDKAEFRKEEPRLNAACGGSLVTENGKTVAFKEGELPRMESLLTSNTEAVDGKVHFPLNASSLHQSDHDNVDGSGKRSLKEDHEARAQIFYSNGHSTVRQTEAWEGEGLNSVPVFQATAMAPMADARAASYPDAGPSNYNPNLSDIYAEGAAKRQNIEGPERVELLEQDRSELLRKLDELRDQLKRSCEVGEAPSKGVPLNGMAASSSSFGGNGRAGWFPDGSSRMNCNPSQHSPFFNGNNVSQHSPFFIGGNVDMPQCNPAANMQNVHGFREASRSYSLAPFHHHGHYPQRSFNNYMYGQLDPDPVVSYHNDGFYHQPACACMHCHNGHWLPPAQVPPAVLSNPRIPPYPLGSHNFYAMDGPSMLGSQGYNDRVPKAPLHSYEPQSQHKTAFISKERRPCRPVAGAAPFIVCYNCSELLQIPEQILHMGKLQHKLQCGSCSRLISFELDGRKLISSNNVSNLQAHTENNNINSVGGAKDVLQCHGNMNRRQVISYSVDYDSPSYYDGRSVDEKIVMPSFPISRNEIAEKECGQNQNESEKLHEICASSSASDGVESPDSVICERDIPSSAELPTEGDAIIRVPSLPLREHFGYPSDNQSVDDPGSGSRSKRSDQEKVISLKGTFKQNSVKDVPVATEMDFSAEDYPNAGFSQESWDVSKDEEDPRVSKGGESFLTGLIKKGFRDFSRFNQSTENGRYRVSVNGHPISDRMVKKAEKLAGPIHPGDYWYDYRAGFWGVMGHSCLGIIPPFIEEFNYPMRRDCAAGNTGVMVNGRELHEEDLTLLASRGLPVIDGHSYIVEISGKVWDEETGEELDSLGKLAPTVERVKRGFGMRVPRVAT